MLASGNGISVPAGVWLIDEPLELSVYTESFDTSAIGQATAVPYVPRIGPRRVNSSAFMRIGICYSSIHEAI